MNDVNLQHMGIEGPNMQGANLRQVLVFGEAAAQIIPPKRDQTEFTAKLAAIERANRPLDQVSGVVEAKLHVQRQEDGQPFQASDAMQSGRDGQGRQRRPRRSPSSTPHSSFSDADDSDDPGSVFLDVEDAKALMSDFRRHLLALPKSQSWMAFAELDRRTLAGLLMEEG